MSTFIHCRHPKNSGQETSAFSNVPKQGIFQSQSLGVQFKKTDKSQLPDLKTFYLQAEHYGHHLDKIQHTDLSVATAIQSKRAENNNTKVIQMMPRNPQRGGANGGGGQQRIDQYGRPIDWHGRVLDQQGNRIKIYAIPYHGNYIHLPIKNFNDPYRQGNQPAFMGGLPTLPGGNLDSKHQNHQDALKNEIKEEMLVGGHKLDPQKNPQLISNFVDPQQRTNYNIYTANLRGQFSPQTLPDRPEYKETTGTFSFDPRTIDISGGQQKILEQILGKASIDPRVGQQQLQQYYSSHVMKALADHIISVNRRA